MEFYCAWESNSTWFNFFYLSFSFLISVGLGINLLYIRDDQSELGPARKMLELGKKNLGQSLGAAQFFLVWDRFWATSK